MYIFCGPVLGNGSKIISDFELKIGNRTFRKIKFFKYNILFKVYFLAYLRIDHNYVFLSLLMERF